MILDKIVLWLTVWIFQIKWLINKCLLEKCGTATIPKEIIEEIARCLLPDIVAYCKSEAGAAEFAQWKTVCEDNKTTSSQANTKKENN